MAGATTKIAIDVHYEDNAAYAAGVLFEHWSDSSPAQTVRCERHGLANYEPGQFYKRELPVIIELLGSLPQPIETIVIDGYVQLGNEQRAGLGMHLWDALDRSSPIVGVAKNRFQNTPGEAELLRGSSAKPLFVSAVGVSLENAKQAIFAMHGEHRIPTLLKVVDQLSRQRM